MAQEADLVKAADALRTAMEALVAENERDFIHVFESSPGHLRITVGSRCF